MRWNKQYFINFIRHHGRLLSVPNSRQFWWFSWITTIGFTTWWIQNNGNPIAKSMPKYLEFSRNEIDEWNKQFMESQNAQLLPPPKVKKAPKPVDE